MLLKLKLIFSGLLEKCEHFHCMAQLFIHHVGWYLSMTLLYFVTVSCHMPLPAVWTIPTSKEWQFSNLSLAFKLYLLLLILNRNIYQILLTSNSFSCDTNYLWSLSCFLLKLVIFYIDIISLYIICELYYIISDV